MIFPKFKSRKVIYSTWNHFCKFWIWSCRLWLLNLSLNFSLSRRGQLRHDQLHMECHQVIFVIIINLNLFHLGHWSFSFWLLLWSIFSYILNLREIDSEEKYEKCLYMLALPCLFLLLVANVIISRIYLRYHTVQQVMAGSFTGILLSCIYFTIVWIVIKLYSNSE